MRILLRIPTARILWDFDFLRGLAPGRLDGFSIERYEENRESFNLYAAKLESGAMCFLGEKLLLRWNPFKTRIPWPFPSIIVTVNGELKIAKKTTFEAKGRLYTTARVIQRLFIIIYIELTIFNN